MIKVDKRDYLNKNFEFLLLALSAELKGDLKDEYIVEILKNERAYIKGYRSQHLPRPPGLDMSHLIKAYKGWRNKMLRLYFDSDGIQGDYCVYCGDSNPTTVDHFFSKTPNPHLAINRINLFWSCGRCNQIKYQSCPNSQMILFHPVLDPLYKSFDILFSVSYLGICVDDDGKPVFAISVGGPSAASVLQQNRIKKTLRDFEIDIRVQKRVLRSINDILSSEKIMQKSWRFYYYRKRMDMLARAAFRGGRFYDYFACRVLRKKRVFDDLMSFKKDPSLFRIE